VQAQLRAQASLPLRLGLLVAGIVLPLTVFATILVYYNYETSRRTAYDQVLQIARGVATNATRNSGRRSPRSSSLLCPRRWSAAISTASRAQPTPALSKSPKALAGR
jgi:hypothetical protein